jgi:hypothetical protein
MPIPNDYQDIVDTLLEKSSNGQAHWKRGQYGVEIEIDDARFSIWGGNDEHTGEAFVAFALNDASGVTLDSWYVDERDSGYDQMRLLFAAAKRYADGIPQRLKGIREQLAKATSIGKPEK